MLLILLCFWLGQGQASAGQDQRAANTQRQPSQSPSPVVERAKIGQAGNGGRDYQENASKWFEPLVVLNFLLLVAILVQAAIYWKQLGVMRKDYNILERHARTFEGQAATMQGQLNVMRDQVAAMQDSRAENREMFYSGQRAYIGIKQVTLNDFAAGRIPMIYLALQNAGNTPAWTIECQGQVTYGDSHPSYEDVVGAVVQNVAHFLPSGVDRMVEIAIGNAALTAETAAEVMNGGSTLFLRARAKFIDISGEGQEVWFCLRFKPRTNTFGDCPDGHEDQNQAS